MKIIDQVQQQLDDCECNCCHNCMCGKWIRLLFTQTACICVCVGCVCVYICQSYPAVMSN